MKIRDKEIGFLYTVGVYCDYNDYVLANPSVSIATAELYKAEIMSRAYAKANEGADVITVDDLRDLMVYELKDIMDAVDAAEKEGTKRLVEIFEDENSGKKNVKTK